MGGYEPTHILAPLNILIPLLFDSCPAYSVLPQLRFFVFDAKTSLSAELDGSIGELEEKGLPERFPVTLGVWGVNIKEAAVGLKIVTDGDTVGFAVGLNGLDVGATALLRDGTAMILGVGRWLPVEVEESISLTREFGRM
jgi:hypothetical protein